MRHARHEPIVGVGVDRRRACAEADEQTVQALVELAGRAPFRGRQVPAGPVEEILAGVLDARRLRAGERMAADEALVGGSAGEGALGRADVRDHAVGSRGLQSRGHRVGQGADGSGDEHDLGACDGRVQADGPGVDRAELQGAREDVLVGVVSAHLGVRAPPRRQADRAADQPDAKDRHPHGACSAPRRIRRRSEPCRPARRSASRWRRTRRTCRPAAPGARRRRPRPGSGGPRR